MNRLLQSAVVMVAMLATVSASADPWHQLLDHAAANHGDFGQRAAAFLAEHRPARDAGIDADLLIENLDYALRAREAFPWAGAVPEAVFFNDVLPYAVLDETRESWRPGFFERCSAIVADAATATEAAQALNRELFNQINVHYNTGRKRPNQSPSESIAQGRATCTGLSIILVDACRAVGVPARVAGVASWHDKRGNHTWVEVWDDGWHFTGADEYNAKGLNRGWFVGDASKAVAGDPEHAVWATSWAPGPGGGHFPMVWDRADTSVHAVDVTRRYTGEDEAGAGPAVYVRLWDTRGGERVVETVEAFDDVGASLGSVKTRAGTADLNDMPALPAGAAVLRVGSSDDARIAVVGTGDGEASRTLDLYWDELGLSEQTAEALVAQHAAKIAESVADVRAAELEAMAFEAAGQTLRIKERVFGEVPEGGHALWISMHGGGGAPAEVNDRQWQNQIGLYEPAEGIYVAPRAPTDTWNLWHQAHIDELFDRMIGAYVALRGVNPDRVYLLGYSAGGDGVFQLAPRMADRFAAAAMMAGHPNETSPLGLRNLPFAIYMGGDDAAYNRNGEAARWRDELAKLREADPEGYPHRVAIYEGLGHWMDRRDAEALPWMAEQVRTAWPERVVWKQDDVTGTRFYWLAVEPEHAKPRSLITASVSGQRIEIESADVPAVTLRLRDELIDLDRPIEVVANGETVFKGVALRTEEAIERSLAERFDPRTAATALLRVELP